jgi:hypothetical protein
MSFKQCYLQPRLSTLPFNDAVPELAVLTALIAGGGGPMLPHPGLVILAADPPSVILRDPSPPGPLFTGESLALLTPNDGSPFSFPPMLLPEKTRLARPGDVAVARRLIPRNESDAKSVREAFARSSDWPG